VRKTSELSKSKTGSFHLDKVSLIPHDEDDGAYYRVGCLLSMTFIPRFTEDGETTRAECHCATKMDRPTTICSSRPAKQQDGTMEVPWPLVCAGSKPINRLQVSRKI
jgi:hypothetical protein